VLGKLNKKAEMAFKLIIIFFPDMALPCGRKWARKPH
jgi:hypothetical protein